MDMNKRMGELMVEGRITANDVRHLQELDAPMRERMLRLIGPENGTRETDACLTRVLADAITGQIAGVNYRGQSMTAGTGSSARY